MPDNSDAASLLSSLFSHSHIHISVPECSSSSPSLTASTSDGRSRSIAFYDEILSLQLHLELPPSAALPRPQRGWASYPLPIQIDENEGDDLSERTEQARATRLALLVFLSNLHIELRGTYASPRPALPPGFSPIPPTSAGTPSHASNAPASQRPLPSTDIRDAAYAEPSLPGDEVPFYTVGWLGNKAPQDPINKEPTAADRIEDRKRRMRVAKREQAAKVDEETVLATSFAMWDEKERRWRIQWTVKVPVVYGQHRSPHPVLLLTSSLSLRLSPGSSLLSALSSSLLGLPLHMSAQVASSWADHDLLTTLSSGPVYPDESPSQRAARAASALAKLPLSRLPSKVLGTRLVTPERSARDVGQKLSSATPLPSMMDEEDDEGDVTDSSSASTPSSSASSWSSGSRGSSTSASSTVRSRDLSEEGLITRRHPQVSVRPDGPSDAKEGDTITTISRSVRCGMDVRSAVGVRMRTTIVPSLDTRAILEPGFRNGTEEEDGEDFEGSSSSAGRALVLCVEIDNPSDSGLLYHVKSCELDITTPGAGPPGSVSKVERSRYDATATLLAGGRSSSDGGFTLAQGEQHNLLYVVQFTLTPEGRATNTHQNPATPVNLPLTSPWPWTAFKSPTSLEEPNRNVAIVLSGRPLLLAGEGNDAKSVTPNFNSTWHCNLDMASLQEDLRRRVAADLPSDEVLASAAIVPSSGTGTSGGVPSASVGLGGSAKHSASALAAALHHDETTARASPTSNVPPTRPGAERSASSRFLSPPNSATFGRLSPIGLGTPKSSPSAPAPASAITGTSIESSAAFGSPGITPSSSASASQRVRSGGVGLLAQARMRAATIRVDEVPYSSSSISRSNRTTSRDFLSGEASRRLTTGDLSALRVSTETGGGDDWVSLRRLVTPNGPRARARSSAFVHGLLSASAAGGGGGGGGVSGVRTASETFTEMPPNRLTQTQSRREVLRSPLREQGVTLPFRLDKDLSWQKRDGLLINTRIRSLNEDSPRLLLEVSEEDDTEEEEEEVVVHDDDKDEDQPSSNRQKGRGKLSSQVPFAIPRMSHFYIEVLLTNRTDTMKTLILTWSLTSTSNVLPSKWGEEAPSVERVGRLLDAESARRRYESFHQGMTSSAIVPLETFISVGPILPGASELALLPMIALIIGRHSLPDLIVFDQDTGEQKKLRGVGVVVVVVV